MFDENPTSATGNVVDGEKNFFHFVPVQISNDDKNDVDVCMHVALPRVMSDCGILRDFFPVSVSYHGLPL